MNLERIEKLSKDKDLLNAYWMSAFKDYCANYHDYEYKEDIPRMWVELENDEKTKLLGAVEYYSCKLNLDDWKTCQVIMEYQNDILSGNMTKWEFAQIYHDLWES